MSTFNEYQDAAIRTPACPDARDVHFPVLGLQEKAGKIGRLLASGSPSGKLALSPNQLTELRGRFGDVLWYTALVCHAAGVRLQDVADASLTELEKRFRDIGST